METDSEHLCLDCAAAVAASNGLCARCGGARLISHPELFDLSIAHIDCDAFYASVEKRDNPALRDKPLLVGHPGGRGVVTTACYIARKFGPRSAMPMFKALELCPHAVVVPPDIPRYRRTSLAIRELFLKATPLVEPLSLDEAYLDLGPDVRLLAQPPAVLLARLARAIERQLGITVSVGLSYNKFLAKMASDRNKPRGFSVIGRAEARDTLAPLPVKALHGVGQATASRMNALGIETVADLQRLPEAELIARFGKFGRSLAQLVQGVDHRRIVPDREPKSISTETTFTRDLTERPALQAALLPLCEKVGQRLLRAELAGQTVVLKLKTGDFRLITRHHRLKAPTQRADLIAAAGLRLLRDQADGRPFRLIGIGVSDLQPAAEADPPDLFAFAD